MFSPRVARLSFTIAALVAAMPLSAQLTRADYQRAESRLVWNALESVRNAGTTPHFIGTSDRFWYVHESSDGKDFVVVDPAKNTRAPAFNHTRLAAALSKAADSSWAANQLPFDSIGFADGEKSLQLTAAGSRWACALATYTCAKLGPVPHDTLGAAPSPDGKWEMFARDHDLYLRETATGTVTRITADGAEDDAWGALAGARTSAITDLRSGRKIPPDGLWSGDSKRFVTIKLDERKVAPMYLLQSARSDSSYRPKLFTYRYPVPGDSAVAQGTLAIVDVDTKKVVKVNTPPVDVVYQSPFLFGELWWAESNKTAYLVRHERGMREYRVLSIDATSGETKPLIEERGNTLVETALLLGTKPNIRVLGDGSVVGFSQRDGWAHLYLFDASGALKNRITQGSWVVREIVDVDEKARTVVFIAGAHESGSDPYYRKLYRASLDGSKIQLLTPDEADHKAWVSPSGKFIVDRFSRLDMAPKTVLRASDGRLVRALEEADISKLLASGWKWPERFWVKAADGTTDIVGAIFFPSNFDANKRYPVLDEVYPGPQVNKTPSSFTAGGDAQALAELGFIVVNIDGRGTPLRAKAFHDYQYGKLELAGGLEDHIAGLKQLATKKPYLDLDRVGVYGHSGGGFMSARAMFQYPDFYKVAVSSAGNHDQRGYVALWGETYMGLPVAGRYDAQANASLAKNLKGKILLAFGDLDDNVQPALTIQVIDALTKANKDYDLLIVPNGNHGFSLMSSYFQRRRWDYFVKNLLGAEPVSGYEIKPATPQGIQRYIASLSP